MTMFDDAAWIVPIGSECDDTSRCRIVLDHPTCSYGQPAVVLLHASCDSPAGTALGPADVRGALITYFGPHKAALAKAGWCVVEDLGEAMAERGLNKTITEPYDDGWPPKTDQGGGVA